MSKPFLRAAFLVLAQRLQEASDLTASDVASRLADQIQDMHRGTGHYAQYHDHAGDGESGDVIYSVDGNTVSAPYEMSKDDAGAAKCYIHSDKATNVVPRTVYEPEADQDELDEYAKMTEAALYTRGPIPLVERNIPKSEREKADNGDFAGKGKSFPILKAEDVMAAFHALGRAGSGNYSTDVIRRNIIKIAKRKGYPLPKSAQEDSDTSSKESRHRTREAKKPMKDCEDCKGSGDCANCDGEGKHDNGKDCADCGGSGDCDTCDGKGQVPMLAKGAKESRSGAAAGVLRLMESVSFPVDIELREAFSVGKKIKIIAPGPGSTAYYTEAALKQAAADKIFHAGLPMRIDHPTKAEESARPEGSVKDWGAVLATDAAWMDAYESAGKDQGPGLYAEIKPFSDHQRTIDEKGPYAGVSIRANGDAVVEAGRVKMKQGLPVLDRFTSAEGCDMVTRAGAGGLFLSESARGARDEESNMNAEEKALLSRLVEKDVRREAIELGARTLEGVALTEAAKMYVVETVIDRGVPKSAGALDTTKFVESINTEARRFGGAIGVGPRVSGMGVAAPAVEITEAQRAARAEAAKADDKRYIEAWAKLMDTDLKIAEFAVRGRAN